jgi:hypothetical protein
LVRHNRLAIGLSLSAVVGCIAAGAWLGQVPGMFGGRYPTLSQVAAMIAVPTIGAVVATWAAWQNRTLVHVIATALVGLFSFVTGFSIGGAFVPAVAFLVWGTFASFANGSVKQAE